MSAHLYGINIHAMERYEKNGSTCRRIAFNPAAGVALRRRPIVKNGSNMSSCLIVGGGSKLTDNPFPLRRPNNIFAGANLEIESQLSGETRQAVCIGHLSIDGGIAANAVHRYHASTTPPKTAATLWRVRYGRGWRDIFKALLSDRRCRSPPGALSAMSFRHLNAFFI